MGELTSRHIVEQLDQGLQERASNFTKIYDGQRPAFAILCDNEQYEPSQQYIKIKQKVAERLGFIATASMVADRDALDGAIEQNNNDPNIHGMIVQLPLKNPEATDEVVSLIKPEKDVDGLGPVASHLPATPMAIVRLLDGYGIDYRNDTTVVLGKGRLVGGPLIDIMQSAGATDLKAFDINSRPEDIREGINRANVIVSATGRPGMLKPYLFDDPQIPRVVVDAGAAEQDGRVHGDVSDELREAGLNNNWLITPEKGGVGPLTVRTLLYNVMAAAEQQKHG